VFVHKFFIDSLFFHIIYWHCFVICSLFPSLSIPLLACWVNNRTCLYKCTTLLARGCVHYWKKEEEYYFAISRWKCGNVKVFFVGIRRLDIFSASALASLMISGLTNDVLCCLPTTDT